MLYAVITHLLHPLHGTLLAYVFGVVNNLYQPPSFGGKGDHIMHTQTPSFIWHVTCNIGPKHAVCMLFSVVFSYVITSFVTRKFRFSSQKKLNLLKSTICTFQI